MIGRIHSTESFGAVDGPGIRFVVFLQGCSLRCLYCHNPDTWNKNAGQIIKSEDLVAKICSYKSFISSGGVTLSGGEPLLQPEFCKAIILGCHKNQFHVAIDTSGAIELEKSSSTIALADLILLDVKDIDSHDCKILTGIGNENALATLNFCEKIGKPVWIRHVLLPEYTLKAEKISALGSFLSKFKCIQKVEILPYHTMGNYKWIELHIPQKLSNIQPPSEESIKMAVSILEEFGLKL